MSRCRSGAACAAGPPFCLRFWTLFVFWLAASAAVPVRAQTSEFQPIYDLLQQHCGACHIQGAADGPWSLNTAPSEERFPQCLAEADDAQLRCATYHQLVDEPSPGIPAWIRPVEASLSEPYVQACDPAGSFHIGHSLPGALPELACTMLLDWIESGARR